MNDIASCVLEKMKNNIELRSEDGSVRLKQTKSGFELQKGNVSLSHASFTKMFMVFSMSLFSEGEAYFYVTSQGEKICRTTAYLPEMHWYGETESLVRAIFTEMR